MGGYFMPTSVAPSLTWPGLISQGLGIIGPIIQGAITKGTGTQVIQKGAEILTRAAGTAAAGGLFGGGVMMGEKIADSLISGGQKLLGIGGTTRKRRRMNVLNARALRRSMRRVQGFSKFARKSFILEKRVKMKRRRR